MFLIAKDDLRRCFTPNLFVISTTFCMFLVVLGLINIVVRIHVLNYKREIFLNMKKQNVSFVATTCLLWKNTHMHTYTHTYIHQYIHTHTHTHTRAHIQIVRIPIAHLAATVPLGHALPYQKVIQFLKLHQTSTLAPFYTQSLSSACKSHQPLETH